MTEDHTPGGIQVKICGLTNLADARAAVEGGADLLGFVFFQRSPRYVTPETARQVVRDLRLSRPDAQVRLVGVFVNMPCREVADILALCHLDLAQLHGDEGPESLQALGGRAFKALRPRSQAEAQAGADRFGGLGPAAGPDLLVDAYHPRQRGGTGETADWRLARALARHQRLLLAGGLTEDNVNQAIAQVQPWGVDVSSGVEAEPGRKDHDKVRAFIRAVKAEA